jgi:hypothetical protein
MKKYRYNEKRRDAAITILAEQVIAMSQENAAANDDQDDVDYDLEVAVADYSEDHLSDVYRDIEDRFNILI